MLVYPESCVVGMRGTCPNVLGPSSSLEGLQAPTKREGVDVDTLFGDRYPLRPLGERFGPFTAKG